jgi:DNA-binding transcriptional LysR family regulator
LISFGAPFDLAAEGFDAGIRLGQFIAPDMIVVRLTPPFPFVVVGSPDYLRKRKRPERIDDLRQHPAHKGSFRLEYIWLGNQNLWRIRHTRPESPQLDSRAGGEKSFWLICARALAAADSIVHED